MKILVTGGARSGKSTFAQQRAEQLAPHRTYLATAQVFDSEMHNRVSKHQAERDTSWHTLEEPLHISPILATSTTSTTHKGGVVLLDCLTLWVTNLLLDPSHGNNESELMASFRDLVDAIESCPTNLVVVTNEVGMSIVPENELARRFRDASGRLNQMVAQVCDEAYLVCSGLPLKLK